MERRIEEINRYTVGWTNYYALADTPSVFEGLDEWLRRRLRQVRWKEWKRPKTKRRRLIALGIRAREATEWSYSRKGYWRVSGSPILTRALPNAYWDKQGLGDSPIPTAASGMPSEPPDADPHVRWCGGRRGEPGASYELICGSSLRACCCGVALSRMSRRGLAEPSGILRLMKGGRGSGAVAHASRGAEALAMDARRGIFTVAGVDETFL